MTRDESTYRIRVTGHLDDRWSSWFDGLVIERYADGTCTLTGPVADQAQLHGVLSQLRDIGTPLLSLRVLDRDELRHVNECGSGSARVPGAPLRGGC